MRRKTERNRLTKACPNCGKDVASDNLVCECGARWVCTQIVEPEFRVLRQGAPLVALFLVAAAIIVELAILARDLYFTDLVWTEAAARMMNFLARIFVPVALVAGYLAYRSVRAVRREPGRYGGLRMARASLMLIGVMLLAHATSFVVRIPQMLENRQVKRAAATRVGMYRLARAIEAYRQQYGSYPRRLIDLQEMDPTIKPALDAWGHEFVYEAITSEVAGVTNPAPFQNYQLISKGSDGVAGTQDDLVMQDDLLLPSGTQPDRALKSQPSVATPLTQTPKR